MLKGLRDFLCGWRTAQVTAEEKRAAFALLFENGLTFSDEKLYADGSVSFRIRSRAARRFAGLAEEAGVPVRFSSLHGMPVLLSFCRSRPAIPLGILLGALWIWASSRLVWEVKITGNAKTPDETVVRQLEELGFGVGTYYPAVNFNRLHARYAVSQNDIAWLSIYMDGTVADVQVQELLPDERFFPPEDTYANVVAAEAGVVEVVHVREGQAAVKPGEAVLPGQVLISGVIENKDGTIRYEYAAGEVFCTTAASVSVKVEPETEEKRYTGREKSVYSVKFFGKSMKLFRKGGIAYATYDTIDKIEQVCPFGLRFVPVWIGKTVYREYAAEKRKRSAEEAAEEAMRRLDGQIREKTAGAELLGKSADTVFRDGCCCVDCLLYLRRDVGKTVEFTVHPETAAPETGESST